MRKQALLDIVNTAIDSIVIEDWVKTEDSISAVEEYAPEELRSVLISELKKARDCDMYLYDLYCEVLPNLESLIGNYYGY